jgi:hypothetical protein
MNVCGRGGYRSPSYAIVLEGANRKLEVLAISTWNVPTLGCVGASPWCCSEANTVRGGGLDVQQVMAAGLCAPGCSPTPIVEVSNFRADINDASDPVATVVGGSLATSNVQTGPETLLFKATDAGVGVFRAVAEARIDGSGDWREVVNAPVRTGGPCTPLRVTD